jgi:hypothetical protein
VTSGRDRPEANAGHPAANGSVAVDAADLVARPPITSNLGTLVLHGMQRVLVHFTDPVLGLLFSAAPSPGLAFLAVAEGAISIAETLVKS